MTHSSFRKFIMLAGLIAAGFCSHAETLLGQNYLGVTAGFTMFGEEAIDDAYGDAYNLRGVANFNLSQKLDLLVDLSAQWADGDIAGASADFNRYEAGSDLVYSIAPGETVNPFFTVGLMLVDIDYRINDQVFEAGSGTDLGIGLGGGVEIELSEKVLGRLGLEYFTVDSQDIINLSGSCGYWVSAQSLVAFQFILDIESNDTSARLAYIYKR